MAKEKGRAKVINTSDPSFDEVKARSMEDLRRNASVVAAELMDERCIGFITVVATEEGGGNFTVSRAAGAAGQPSVTIEMLNVLSDLGNDVAAGFGKSLREHDKEEENAGN